MLQVATFLDENWKVITSCAAHKKLLKFEKGTDFGGSVVEEDQHLLDQLDLTKAAQMLLLRIVPDGATTHLKVMVLMTWLGDGVWSMHLQDITGHAGILQKQMTQYHEAMYALQAPMMVVNDDLQVTPIVCPTFAGQDEGATVLKVPKGLMLPFNKMSVSRAVEHLKPIFATEGCEHCNSDIGRC